MNLFMTNGEGRLEACEAVPFETEEKLEDLLYANGDLLGIVPLGRQVKGGAKPGIPDIIGIDQEGAVCIVEVKNVHVDETILPQVLAYAIWAESHPDSIHKMWYEKTDRPEHLQPDFKNYVVKIIVVAPSIRPSTAHHMRKVTFDVTLLEVKRFRLGGQLAVSVHQVEDSAPVKVRTTSGQGTYDQAWYQANGYGAEAVAEYFRLIEQAAEIVTRQGWPLEPKLNKNYASFKNGGSIAFGIDWATTKELSIFFKLTDEQCRANLPENCGSYKYDNGFKQGHVRLSQGKAGLKELLPLMELSVRRFGC